LAADTELLDAWAQGDAEAGRALYVRYADRVTRFFARKTRIDTADLVQRTFLKCLDARRRGTVGDAAGLLFSIARNELYDHYRARARDAARFTPERTSLEDLGVGPSAHAAQREEHRMLLGALTKLPIDDQLALELYYWEELPMDDVARVLGITKSAAINRVHRARDRVRGLIRRPSAAEDPSVEDFEEWARSLAGSDVLGDEPAGAG
jgi:RNA polymerase sigma-70 factor (ECF subfamily)